MKAFSKLLREYVDDLIWTPAYAYKELAQPTYNAIERVKKLKLKFVTEDIRHFIAVNQFWKSYGLEAVLSTGFYFINTALDMCDKVDAFGFWPFDKNADGEALPYHYFPDNITSWTTMADLQFHHMNQEFAIITEMHHKGLLELHIGNCS